MNTITDADAAPVDAKAAGSIYDRIARVYDALNTPMDKLGGKARRRRLIAQAMGSTLEVGIGTGANLDLYLPDADLSGIDISPRMPQRARARAARLGRRPTLLEADVERLPFPDERFDTVLATCVFCSVNDPVQGLREVRRVVRPGGKVLLLEHVRPENPLLGWLADLISPVTKRLMGPELNRRTEANVIRAGLHIEAVRRAGVWREIVARRKHERVSRDCPSEPEPSL